MRLVVVLNLACPAVPVGLCAVVPTGKYAPPVFESAGNITPVAAGAVTVKFDAVVAAISSIEPCNAGFLNLRPII
jgi:hypothetical protein